MHIEERRCKKDTLECIRNCTIRFKEGEEEGKRKSKNEVGWEVKGGEMNGDVQKDKREGEGEVVGMRKRTRERRIEDYCAR